MLSALAGDSYFRADFTAAVVVFFRVPHMYSMVTMRPSKFDSSIDGA